MRPPLTLSTASTSTASPTDTAHLPAPLAPLTPVAAPPPRARRVSYVLPPTNPSRLFGLPPPGASRRGRSGPLLLPCDEARADEEREELREDLSPDGHSTPTHTRKSHHSASSRIPSISAARSGTGAPPHPRHTLAVSSLAIDSSTVLTGLGHDGQTPQGILYTGGRDGLVCSWELGLRMRRRRAFRRRPGWADHLDRSTGQDDDDDEEDDERETEADLDDEEASLGLLSGRRRTRGRPARPHTTANGDSSTRDASMGTLGSELELPYEHRWEVDPLSVHPDLPGVSRPSVHGHGRKEGMMHTPKTTFRQCVQSHTDWINDIVLCNSNQTVISASSDRTLKLWNPHDPLNSLTPTILGTHKDFVKCLAHGREAGWIASGGLDRRIKLWDIRETRQTPLVDLAEPSPRSSVYALAVNPAGNVLAAGSPERVVRVWDPRAGSGSSGSRIAKLVGHTDNIRAVLVSDDGRHLLSGSSDSTVRLWSLGEQRCLHTFTHHSDSVWSLFSTHPNLDIFYSGDRQGYVAKVDWERCAEVAEGECAVLCRHTTDSDESSHSSKFSKFGTGTGAGTGAGVHKIVALDNSYLWTSSGSSSIARWRDIPSRSCREALYPITSPQANSPCASSPSLSLRGSPVPGAGAGAGSPGPVPIPAPRLPVSPLVPETEPSRPRPRPQHRSTLSTESAVSFAFSEFRRGLSGATAGATAGAGTRVSRANAKASASIFGIPFKSLVSLAPLNDPYGAAVGLGSVSLRDPAGLGEDADGGREREGGREGQGHGEGDVVSMYSAASVLSVPGALRGGGAHGGGPSAGTYRANPNHPASAAGLGSPPASPSRGLGRTDSPASPLAHFQAEQQQQQMTPKSARSAGSIRFAEITSTSGSPTPGPFFDGDTDADADADTASSDSHDDSHAASASAEAEAEDPYFSRLAYEDRELAEDATPLRAKPDEILKGSHGLIQSSMLNDRRHVLTVDTKGTVALWDIVKAKCLGAFCERDVQRAVWAEGVLPATNGKGQGPASAPPATQPATTPLETLEIVKERIEGQGTTPLWCLIDTRIGALTVHLEEPRCFDAEVYVDEIDEGAEGKEGAVSVREGLRTGVWKEDQRINIGKMVLRSLFEGFISTELYFRQGPNARATPGVPAFEQSKVFYRPMYIPFVPHGNGGGREPWSTSGAGAREGEGEGDAQALEQDGMQKQVQTPGMTIALATPARTPALPPPGVVPLSPAGAGAGAGLSNAAGTTSPTGTGMLQRTLPAAMTFTAASAGAGGKSYQGSNARTPVGQVVQPGDYFSLRGSGPGPSGPSGGAQSATTPAANASANTDPVSPINGIGGNQGLMSRLRFGFGGAKSPKMEKGPGPAVGLASLGAGAVQSAQSAQNGGGGGAGAEGGQGSGQLVASSFDTQHQIVYQVLSRPLTPCPISEAPPLRYDPNTALLLSSSSPDAGSWEVLYRGLVRSTGSDVSELERCAPGWLLEFLLNNKLGNREREKEREKVSFVLQPWVGPDARPDGFGGFETATGTGPLGAVVMPDLPSGNARLTATRMLRIKKVCTYICERLDLISASVRSRSASIAGSRRSSADTGSAQGGAGTGGGGAGLTTSASALSMTSLAASASASASSSSASQDPSNRSRRPSESESNTGGEGEDSTAVTSTDLVEILCNDQVLPNGITLATCQRFYWRAGGDIRLEYRRKVV